MSSKTKSTATKEGAKTALVPKLRFPEFRNTQPWQPSELGKESSILKGKGISKSDIHPDGTQQCIRYGELYTHYGEIIGSVISRTKLPAEELFLSKANDVIIPSSGETKIDIATASCVLLDRVALGGDLNVIRSKLNGPFLSYYLNGPKRFDIAKVAQGDTVVHLYPYQLEELEIAFPHPAEQQKIAECLSSVDELLAAQARKLDALKTHKKGLMQQLFPREGETQPRLRFPEFENAGEWVSEKLSSCLEKVIDYRGIAPPKSESGVPLITAKNVRFGWLDMTNDEYIEEDKYEEWMSRGIPQAGDILFTTEAPLGNVALFPRAGRFALGQRLLTLRSKSGRCLSEFLFHSLLGPTMQEEIDFHSTGSTAKGIKSAVFVNLDFCYPNDLDEQKRIADCLTSLDDLIAAQTQTLEALKTHKQGLMQQLFPSPELAEA
jgi:type I restriction enzyme, S subunit